MTTTNDYAVESKGQSTMTKKLQPKLRFRGFTDAWEQRELGEIAEVAGGGTPDTNNPSYWNGNIDWFTPAEIGSSTYVADSKRKITEEGLQHSSANLLPAYRTILFTSRASIGLTAILTTDACTNQGFQSLVASDRADVFFLYSLCDRIKRQAIRNAAGSTFLEVSGKQLAKIPVQVPSLAEQRRIGGLFQVIDTLIAAEKRKLNLLQDKKTALIQQIFDRMLRFKGCNDVWEPRKLKDMYKRPLLIEPTRTTTYLSWSVPAFNDGVPEIVQGSEIASVKQSVSLGDILLCRINPRINRVWVVESAGNTNFPMIASTEWVVFANKDGDSHFLSALFSSNRFRNMLLSEVAGVTGSQKRFQVASVLRHEESFPPKLEQKRIGDLFSKLDQLIAAESRKIDLLELKKKALLQQMFV